MTEHNAPGSRLNDLMPILHVRSAHQITVNASAELTFTTLDNINFADNFIVRFLMRLRRFGKPEPTPKTATEARDATRRAGFVELARVSGREVVIGIAGKFWRPDSGVDKSITPENFAEYCTEGHSKAAWHFLVTPESDQQCVLSTQTRVLAFGRAAERKFRTYWFFVGPFSGLIRIVMLRQVKAAAERSVVTSKD